MSYKKVYDFLSSFRWQLKELGSVLDIPDDVISRLESDIFIVILAIDTYMLNLGKRMINNENKIPCNRNEIRSDN